ncbi:RICIN domain-containing protein [Actinospica sp. MGRD01-02]|uniref:RICIN domain-containing protein n=1 Tax=Actinospica acidithermotolerans TaxID=2828514 RepID=A0A941IKF4_9ACTN|nr:RICIN domain-containing protein [Actinospica acidithermotolerans]MBR7828867.1 RICIN domain-containing protein [Actinospica acidithermotolerans]
MTPPHEDPASTTPVSRRAVLATLGLGIASAAAAAAPAFVRVGATAAAATTYAHPGLLHTQADFDRMATQVSAGAQPWKAGWDRLARNSHASSSWTASPQTSIVRGSGCSENYGTAYNDIAAAYQNALYWKVTGDTAHADTAAAILNGWASTLESISLCSSDGYLAAGLYGYQFANAAEIMRDYSGFDLAAFQDMMLNVFYPVNYEFLVNHNDACVHHYWANWDLCNMCSILAIGILCDDSAKVNQAIDYFYSGAGNGSINNLTPFTYSGGLAQCQESGRDQAHTMLDVALVGAFCQMAWNQGVDLFGYESNRVLQMCEYVAKYNLGNDVSYTTYSWYDGTDCATLNSQTTISSSGRGNIRPCWALIYNHYVALKGLSAPYTAAYATLVGPEGGGGDYGSTSGGFDQLGFGTLAYTLDSGPLPHGIYTLTNQMSGLNLDNDSATADGSDVVQWTANGDSSQQWAAIPLSGGNYTLTNQMSGKNLDSDSSTTNGHAVVQWTANGDTAQQWKAAAAGDGYFTLTNHLSGKNLDNDSVTTSGSTVVQWTIDGASSQNWLPTWVGPFESGY